MTTMTLENIDKAIAEKFNNNNTVKRRRNNVISEVVVHRQQNDSNDNVFKNVKKTVIINKDVDADSIFSNVKKTTEVKTLAVAVADKSAISALYDTDNCSRRKFFMIAFDACMSANIAFDFKTLHDLFDQYNAAFINRDYNQSNANAIKSILCQSYRFEMYDTDKNYTRTFENAVYCVVTEKRSKRKY